MGRNLSSKEKMMHLVNQHLYVLLSVRLGRRLSHPGIVVKKRAAISVIIPDTDLKAPIEMVSRRSRFVRVFTLFTLFCVHPNKIPFLDLLIGQPINMPQEA